MLKLRIQQWLRITILAAVVTAGPGGAGGDVVRAGYDAMDVVAGAGSWIDFGAEPIPAGRFGPDSQAFTKIVPLEPRPIALEQPDAAFRRPDDVTVAEDAEAVIPAELTTLNLISAAPITIDMGFYPAFFDVIIRIPLDQAGLGQWVVREDADGLGGTILRDLPGSDPGADSFFDIIYEIEFAETCSCSWTEGPNRSDRLNLASDVPYSHDPPTEAATFDESSKFFPGGTPGDPDAPPATLQLDGAVLHVALELMEDPHIPSVVMGDADYDLDVDLDDFMIVKQHFGTTTGATWEMGDFNLSGSVDLDDFTILKNNFGAAAVPEPSVAILLALGTAVLRRRRG
ncbi:MAG: PEP-CTERM sorting domain-containing protein [Planctomycetota bacterium]